VHLPGSADFVVYVTMQVLQACGIKWKLHFHQICRLCGHVAIRSRFIRYGAFRM